MFDPSPELPDNTPTRQVRFPTRIQNVLIVEGLKTIGQIRETTDEVMLSYQDFGSGSVAYLREALGLPSKDGVRPLAAQNEREGKYPG